MLKTIVKTLWLCTLSWSLVLLPSIALASNDATLTCTNGQPTPGTVLYNTDPNDANSACYYTGEKHIFSQVICNTISIVNDVLSNMYCSMQDALKNLLAIVITLYIAVFGVQILIGTTRLNAREIVTRLIKIAAVWVLVTESWAGIGIAFSFFLAAAGDGVAWVMSALPNALATPPGQPPSFCHDPNAAATTGVMAGFARLDELICDATVGPLTTANSKTIGIFLAMMVIPPLWPVFGLAAYWLWMNFVIMVRALISFLLAIVALAFLIALSPIFLSMMLFKVTFYMFENWLKYMTSFAVQVVIIFACIALWMLVTLNFVGFFNDLGDTVFYFQKVQMGSAVQNNSDTWGICPYDFSPTKPGSTQQDFADYMPYVKCKPTFNPRTDDPIPASAFLLNKEDANGDPVDSTLYIFYVIYHLIVLIIIAYAFQALMQSAPSIAVQLSGPQYVPMIGGGGFAFNRYGQLMTRGAPKGETQKSTLSDLLQNAREKIGKNIPDVTNTYRQNIAAMFNKQRNG